MDLRILRDISDFLFVSDPIEPADVIFLPGCSYPDQPEKAADLWKAGFAKWVIPSGAFSQHGEGWQGVSRDAERYAGNYRTESEFFADVLKQNGVPEEAIIEEKEARFTRDNAVLSKQLLDARDINPQTAILICRAFHARRALIYYQMAFPKTKIMVCPVHTVNITKENWYHSQASFQRVMGELAKCGNQLLDEMQEYLRGQSLCR